MLRQSRPEAYQTLSLLQATCRTLRQRWYSSLELGHICSQRPSNEHYCVCRTSANLSARSEVRSPFQASCISVAGCNHSNAAEGPGQEVSAGGQRWSCGAGCCARWRCANRRMLLFPGTSSRPDECWLVSEWEPSRFWGKTFAGWSEDLVSTPCGKLRSSDWAACVSSSLCAAASSAMTTGARTSGGGLARHRAEFSFLHSVLSASYGWSSFEN